MNLCPLILNEKWRVIDLGDQWCLQIFQPQDKAGKRDPWRNKYFCATREGLEQTIFYHVDWKDHVKTPPQSVERVHAGKVSHFPEWHPGGG